MRLFILFLGTVLVPYFHQDSLSVSISSSNYLGRSESPNSLQNFEVCVCCCERFREVGVGPCNHPIACGLCNLRLRLLLNETNCVICKQSLDQLYITSHRGMTFEALQNSSRTLNDSMVGVPGVVFRDDVFRCRFEKFKSFDCVICNRTHESQRALAEHAKSAHGRTFCRLCLIHRKVFPQEQVRPYGKLLGRL